MVSAMPTRLDKTASSRFHPAHWIHDSFVRWRSQHLLATKHLIDLSDRTGKHDSSKPRVIAIDGQLEEVWSSPTHGALLTLVRPRDATGDVRRLFFNNDTLVYEGSFTITRSDVFWSSSGTSFAARLQIGSQGKVRQRLVTPVEDREFLDHVDVREVMVNDGGYVEAVIAQDGAWDKPIVRGRRLTAVPLAWNLYEDPDGGIAWNTIHDDLVLKWIDRTHLQQRTARYATQR